MNKERERMRMRMKKRRERERERKRWEKGDHYYYIFYPLPAREHHQIYHKVTLTHTSRERTGKRKENREKTEKERKWRKKKESMKEVSSEDRVLQTWCHDDTCYKTLCNMWTWTSVDFDKSKVHPNYCPFLLSCCFLPSWNSILTHVQSHRRRER